MKFFKETKTGEVFAFEADGSQDSYIKPSMREMTPQEVDAHINPPPLPMTEEQISTARFAAYQTESDPLFFKVQRGEIDKQVWLDKVAEIKARWV